MMFVLVIAVFGLIISGFAAGFFLGISRARRWEKIAQNAIKAAENANITMATWQRLANDWQTTAERATALLGVPTIQ